MFSQFAHCLELSKRLHIPLHVDWRNTLYSADAGYQINTFGTHLFHDQATPVERLMETSVAADREKMRTFDYKGNIDSDVVHALLAGNINAAEITRENNGLIITGPVHIKDMQLVYENLRGLYVSQDLRVQAEQVVSVIGAGFNAIHYRHGNGEFKDFKGRSEHHDEISEIQALYALTTDDTETPIYIATNSTEADEIFAWVFRDYSKTVFAKKPALEVGIAPHYAGIVNPDTTTNMHAVFQSAVVDMLVLSQARMIFRDSWSSFTNYSCAVASANPGFREVHYPVRRRRFIELASAAVFHRAAGIVSSRAR